MKAVALVLFFSLASATSIKSKLVAGPSFCHDQDCPKYTTVSVSKEGYETRQYSPSKWVGTTSTGTSYSVEVGKAFRKLFAYIEGANREGTKVPMAVPVASKIVPLGTGQSNFTTLFFVPFDYQASTPIPTDPTVAIVELPAITAYVKSFGGFMHDEQVKENIEKLRLGLDKDGLTYITDFYFVADYDSPYRLIDRHNEVWLLPQGI